MKYKAAKEKIECMNVPCVNAAIINATGASGFIPYPTDPAPFNICEPCFAFLTAERHPATIAYRKFKKDKGVSEIDRNEVVDLVEMILK